MSDLRQIVTLPSGVKLELQHAPFEVAMKLLQTIARELIGVATGLNVELSLGNPQAMIEKLIGSDLSLDLIKNAVCQIVASGNVTAILRECMGRCLYDGRAIGVETFEPAIARGDYFPAAWEVMKHNLLPFFKGLGAKSLTAKSPAGGSPP